MDFKAVAHDLRTPLNVMLGCMHLLSVEPLSDCGRQRLSVVEAQVLRMMRLLDTCTDQLSAARFAPVDLAVVVQDALSELDGVLEKQPIEIASNVGGDLLLREGDRDLLHRLILNLLMNAVDSIEDAGRIEIEARAMKGSSLDVETIDIDITDTGAGIPAELLPQVFDYGFTTKQCGRPRGLGLGICREIIQLHRGRIRLTSAPGRGTTVNISLPVKS